MTVAAVSSAMDAFDLDNFDQWFSTFDKKTDSENDPWLTDSPNPKGKGRKLLKDGKKKGKAQKTKASKKTKPANQVGLRIYDSSDDSDESIYSSDGSRINGKGAGKCTRRRSDPSNTNTDLQRNATTAAAAAGALEQIMFGQPTNPNVEQDKKKKTKKKKASKSKETKPKRLSSSAKPENKAIQLLRDFDLKKAKESRLKRRGSKDESQQDRKKSVSKSLGMFLDAAKADIDDAAGDNEDAMEVQSRATTGMIVKDRRKLLSRSKSINISEKDLSNLFNDSHNLGDSFGTTPTEATSFTSRSSNGDVSTSTEGTAGQDGKKSDRAKRAPRRSTREAHRASKNDDEPSSSRSRSRSSSVGPARYQKSVPRRRSSDTSSLSGLGRSQHGRGAKPRGCESSESPEDVLSRIKSLSSSRHSSSTASRLNSMSTGGKKRADLLSHSEHVGTTRSRRPSRSTSVDRRDPLMSRSSHVTQASAAAAANRRQMYSRSSSLKSVRQDDDDQSIGGRSTATTGASLPARRRLRRESGLSYSVHGGQRTSMARRGSMK